MGSTSKMSVKVSKQFFYAISPVLFLARLFGLAPVSYNYVGDKVVLRRSWKWIIYNYISAPTCAFVMLYGIDSAMSNPVVAEIRRGSPTAKYTEFLELTVIVVTFSSRIVLSPFKTRNFLMLLTDLDEVDRCSKLENNLLVSGRQHNMRLVILVTVIQWITHFANDYCFEELTNGAQTFIEHFIYYFGLYLVCYNLTISFAFYYNLVYLIMKRIEKLNVHLQLLKVKLEEKDNERNIKNIKDGNKIETEDSILEYINMAMKIHIKICSAIHRCNDEYGFPLLFSMTLSIYYLVTSPYHLLLKILGTTSAWIVMSELLWFILHLVKVLHVILICGKCGEEIKHTMVIVRQCISLDISERLRQQLEILQSQLRQAPADFTILGICTIDKSLIASISGIITTYVVILFQYK